MRILAITLSLVTMFCMPRQHRSPREQRMAAASLLTRRCAASRLAKWNIRGIAAGDDCNVLIVDTPMVLDDTVAEAIHYGTGGYAIVDGGVRRFVRESDFRGVAYRDGTGQLRTYGDITRSDARGLQPCR